MCTKINNKKKKTLLIKIYSVTLTILRYIRVVTIFRVDRYSEESSVTRISERHFFFSFHIQF